MFTAPPYPKQSDLEEKLQAKSVPPTGVVPILAPRNIHRTEKLGRYQSEDPFLG